MSTPRPVTAAERADVAALAGMAAVEVPGRLSAAHEEAQAKLVVALHGTLLESRNNAAAKQRSAVEALATLVTNVLDAPGEPKFRKLRCGNEALKARLFCAKGAEDFLKAAGWRERTLEYQRHLVLEDGFDAELLAIAGRLLQKCQEKVKEKAERAEREEWLRKNEAELRRQATLVALAEDKERRREAAERAREERAAAAAAAEAARAAASAAAAAEAEASAELLRKARQPR